MRNLLFIVLVLAVFTSCDNSFNNNHNRVRVKVMNISEYDIQGLTINQVDFGDITSASKTDFENVEGLYGDEKLVGAYITAEIDGEIIETYSKSLKCELCGGGINYLTNGRYDMELDIAKVDDSYTFHLKIAE